MLAKPAFHGPGAALCGLALAAGAALLAGCAGGPKEPSGCWGDAEAAERVRQYLALQAQAEPAAGLSPEAAACSQRKWVAALAPTHGKVVGYKAGLTNAAVQKRFNIDHPLLGTLLEKMLLKDGAEVPARFGVQPFLEADLMVEVGSSAVHDARTPQQVAAALRAVVPFIELPDTLVRDPSRLDAGSLRALNVGARLGVRGAAIPVRDPAAWAEALGRMTVRTTDGSGKELASAGGGVILGHPLNAVVWLAGELRRQGITLQPGDLLSLGSFSASPVAAGQVVRVTYDGLPGQPAVDVKFR